MKRFLVAPSILLMTLSAVILAIPTHQPLDAIPCCDGANHQSAQTHWTMGNDCDEAEDAFLAETMDEAESTCGFWFPCEIELPACYFDSGSSMWAVDGKLTWGCYKNCPA